MGSKSPTARSLAMLREAGFQVGIVEYYSTFTKKRHDLFGIIDLVAVHTDLGVLGVQVTSSSNHSARFRKACRAPIRKWLEAGAKMTIQSWGLRGAAGTKKKWHCRVQQVKLEDLVERE